MCVIGGTPHEHQLMMSGVQIVSLDILLWTTASITGITDKLRNDWKSHKLWSQLCVC